MTEDDSLDESERRQQIEEMKRAIKNAERMRSWAPLLLVCGGFLLMWSGGVYDEPKLATVGSVTTILIAAISTELYGNRILLLKMELREYFRGEWAW